MASMMHLLLVVAAFTFSIVAGREKFGNVCDKYEVDEPLDDLADGQGRECRLSVNMNIEQPQTERYRYCKTFDCPDVSCPSPTKGEDGCMRCPGECQWGGKIYGSGEGGTCVDGCNICRCSGGGVSTTLMLCSDEFFCGQ